MSKMPSLAMAVVAALLAANHPASGENTIFPSLKGELVESKGKKLEPFDETPLANAKHYAIYYSAAWCGPCRAFTPDLVRWYKRNKSKNPDFELIFVSSDRSAEEMAQYMKDDNMPWPALAFDKKRSSPLAKYSGKGIPCLVFIDASGNVLSHSYKGQEYVGPRKVLEDIEKTLKSNSAGAGAGEGGPKKAGSSSFDDFFKKKPAAE